jgi:arylsulfatase A-like enzyme
LLKGKALQAAQAGYFGLIEQLDHEVAPLIEDFKARSQKAGRPWLVWVIADHGEMLGDHGYFRKCEPFEGSANIPFLVAGSPDLGFRNGLRSCQPVCLEDVMPTVLELAGVPRPDVLDGVSLVPVLRGQPNMKTLSIDRLVRERTPSARAVVNPQHPGRPASPVRAGHPHRRGLDRIDSQDVRHFWIRG